MLRATARHRLYRNSLEDLGAGMVSTVCKATSGSRLDSSSNLDSSTRRIAQLVRAVQLDRTGRRFDSCSVTKKDN